MAVDLPDKEKLTVRWLVDMLPISWVWALITILLAGAAACISVGIEYGRRTAAVPGIDEIKKINAERDRLANEVGDLVARREGMKAELMRLQIDLQTSKMTPEEVREALKKWTR